MIIINSKLPAFRSFKADVNHSAVTGNEDESVAMDSEEDTDKHKKPTEQSKDNSHKKESKKESDSSPGPTKEEIKSKNMKLLNTL